VDWTRSAAQVRNFVRALAHEPAALTAWAGEPLKLGRAEALSGPGGEPGTVLALEKGRGPVVACGQGAVLLREVKPSGKGWMDAWAFVQGRRLEAGARFGGE
jgi:methionyl-tRNA formyltransferase